MNFDIDVSLEGLVLCGFAISWGLYALSRGLHMIIDLFASRSGRVRPY